VRDGTITVGESMLAPGQAMPPPVSVIDGRTVKLEPLRVHGGASFFPGDDLFTEYQAAYDSKLLWVGSRAEASTIPPRRCRRGRW